MIPSADYLAAAVERLLALASPWPAIFALDLGRYLMAATVLSGVIMLIPHRVAVFRRVRRSLPKPLQRWRELRHSVAAAAMFGLVGLGVYHGVGLGSFRVYPQVAELGWWYWAASIALIVVAHDTYFYWTHRLMHHPRLFRRVHQTHHQSVAPTVWAAYSFSALEAIVQAIFLPLFLLAVPLHDSVLFLWMIHQIVRNVLGHSGVAVEPKRWLAGWWGRWSTTTLHHDMHHQYGRGNYGLYFAWWDRWCGTEHPEYRDRLATLIEVLDEQPVAPSRQESTVQSESSRAGAAAGVVALLMGLGSLASSFRSEASQLLGEWATQGNSAHVNIAPCAGSPDTACGVITWLWEPTDADGRPIRDNRNPDERLRTRSLLGTSLLTGFRVSRNAAPSEGQIYNPENGRTYRATLKLRNADLLEVKGCLLFVPKASARSRRCACVSRVRSTGKRRLRADGSGEARPERRDL
jgi:sterol desaturase/sphingolipid hydroxylase (fatty acid hydroxylase superfamily)/uncharacterized protein (DUF2147 family)